MARVNATAVHYAAIYCLNNWTGSESRRHTTAPVNRIKPSPCSPH